MNITHLTVTDPRMEGKYADPFVTVYVDEEVDEIDRPVFDYKKHLQLRMIPCGPFFAIEWRPDNGVTYDEWRDATATEVGIFNTTGIDHRQMVPVTVETPEATGIPLNMEVVRLRRMLRKFTGKRWGWQLVVDEEAAMQGRISWRLTTADPVCYGGAIPRGANCSSDPTSTIFVRGAHLPVCTRHRTDIEISMRRYRATANN